jgi:two-component system response regulator RegX3
MDNAASPKKIVIVEDNASLADIYKTRLELLGYICFIGYNGITGLYFIQQEIPDLVLLDLMIPDIPGDQVLATMTRLTSLLMVFCSLQFSKRKAIYLLKTPLSSRKHKHTIMRIEFKILHSSVVR